MASIPNLVNLLESGVCVLDGGLATQIQKQCGTEIIKDSQCSEEGDPLWSARLLLTNPDVIVAAHKSFIRAGARLIETASYHCNLKYLTETEGLTPLQAQNTVKSSVTLVRRAIDECKSEGSLQSDERVLIVGSVGPYAITLYDGSEYNGWYVDTVPSSEIENYHQKQASPLIEAGVDVIAFETVPAKKEADAICAAVQHLSSVYSSMPPIWISFSCKSGDLMTNKGDWFADAAVSAMQSSVVSAVGINCSSPDNVYALLESARQRFTSISQLPPPFVVYPNSGEEYKAGVGWANDSSAAASESMVKYVTGWIEVGAKIIGGCCRVYDTHISEMKRAVVVHNNSTT